jgi:hypothetical protein
LREVGRGEDADSLLHRAWGVSPAPWPGIDQEWCRGLRAARVRDALLIPVHPDSVPRFVGGGIRAPETGPAYLQQLRAEPGSDPSLTTRLPSPPDPGQVTELPGTHLYAGPFLKHFGHFVAECSHRLWGYRQYARQIDRVLVLGGPAGPLRRRARSFEELLPFQQQALAWFGVPPARVSLVDAPTRVEHLVVPEQGAVFGGAIPPSSAYIDLLTENAERFFAACAPARGDYPERLYVSRAHLLHQGGIAGEGYLERLLEGAGFHVFRPECHSLHEQLGHYRQARIALFSEGSALHGLELLGRLPERPVMAVLGRRADGEPQWRRIVSPRTPHYAFCACTLRLPALQYNRVIEAPVTWHALSVVHDLDGLLDFLETHVGLRPGAFDRDAFYLQEAADIARYLLRTSLDPGDGERGQRYLARWRRRLAAMTQNPYLGAVARGGR